MALPPRRAASKRRQKVGWNLEASGRRRCTTAHYSLFRDLRSTMMLASSLQLGAASAVRGQRVRVSAPRVQAQAVRVQTRASAAAPKRAFNFSAGPACLPMDVLKQAQAEMVDWQGSGMSVLEMSHRGPEFMGIIAKAEKDLRTLMKVPDNYKARVRVLRVSSSQADTGGFSVQVLFVQGGASTQFAALPLNFAAEGETVDFVVTGSWGQKCVKARWCPQCAAPALRSRRSRLAGRLRRLPSTTR